METAISSVVRRPVRPEDREFLIGLYWSTREAELAQVAWPPGQQEAFVRMQFDAQDTQYRQHNPDGAFEVIEVDGRPAGRLYVDRRPGDIRIIDIALLPEFCGTGIGAALIGALATEAAGSGRTVSIHVEIHNRAAGLYERLGFTAVADRGVYRLMEWRP